MVSKPLVGSGRGFSAALQVGPVENGFNGVVIVVHREGTRSLLEIMAG